MTTENYMELRNEIEDSILDDMVAAIPWLDDVYSEDIVDAVFSEMFGSEELGTIDRIVRRDAIRGVLVYLQTDIENLYEVLSLNQDKYEEAADEEEMADWVDSTYIMPLWFVVRHAVHKYWTTFREGAETK